MNPPWGVIKVAFGMQMKRQVIGSRGSGFCKTHKLVHFVSVGPCEGDAAGVPLPVGSHGCWGAPGGPQAGGTAHGRGHGGDRMDQDLSH